MHEYDSTAGVDDCCSVFLWFAWKGRLRRCEVVGSGKRWQQRNIFIVGQSKIDWVRVLLNSKNQCLHARLDILDWSSVVWIHSQPRRGSERRVLPPRQDRYLVGSVVMTKFRHRYVSLNPCLRCGFNRPHSFSLLCPAE